MMKLLLVGHRGVGKSTFLKRHAQYFPKIKHLDLDSEIESSQNLTIDQIFKRQGEAIFRKFEVETLEKLILEHQEYVITLGAGFPLDKLPSKLVHNFKIIFISRVTDSDGRIFLNRPDFDAKIPPLQQYLDRYSTREKKYLNYADFIYDMPEGLNEKFNLFEKKIFSESFAIDDAFYTLEKQDLPQLKFWMKTFSKIELRTDLLSTSEILKIIKDNPYHSWLVAFRQGCDISLLNQLDLKKNWIDWDVQLPPTYLNKFKPKKLILSCHEDNCLHGIELLESFKTSHNLSADLKLSPKIDSFKDLQLAFQWQQKNSEQRNVLPRSDDGRWLWFRQLAKYFQRLNFLKNRLRLNDQPSFYQWLTLPEQQPSFWGAVLGAPIKHSRSPVEQQDYFFKKDSFFSSVLTSVDFSIQDLNFLNKLGLNCVAITSPNKELFFQWSQKNSEIAHELKSVNTAFIHQHTITGANTDLKGFQRLIEEVQLQIPNLLEKETIIWGGGGTLQMIKSVLPFAKTYSASQAKPRNNQAQALDPKILIWAAPRKADICWPTEANSDWKFEAIIDLNYQENSMGLEFAKKHLIPYFSGDEMFKAQAFEQRIFWNESISLSHKDRNKE